MTKWVFLNDVFVPEEKATIHYRDLAFQRGYGVFDFLRLIEHTPLLLDEHLERFYASARGLHLQVPFDKAQLAEMIFELIKKNAMPSTGIRLSLTGGYSPDGFTIAKPNLLLSQHVFDLPSASQRSNGIKLVSFNYQRQLPEIKTIDYLMAIWLQPFKKQHGADEILYHFNGNITECPRSNFFLVTRDEKIITAAENVLKGITRNKVLEIASRFYAVEERPITFEDISQANEAFITSTTKELLWVSQVDEKLFQTKKITASLLHYMDAASS